MEAESIMNRIRNQRSLTVPKWQSEKMRKIFVKNWVEVWEIVESREKERKNAVKTALLKSMQTTHNF